MAISTENSQVLKNFRTAPLICSVVDVQVVVGVANLAPPARSVKRSHAHVPPLRAFQIVDVGHRSKRGQPFVARDLPDIADLASVLHSTDSEYLSVQSTFPGRLRRRSLNGKSNVDALVAEAASAVEELAAVTTQLHGKEI